MSVTSHELMIKEETREVINFLKTNVPSEDISNINNELKKDFVFAKRKSKSKKQKDKKKKNHYLNRTEKKAIGFYNIPKKSFSYNDMLKINLIWNNYMSQILNLESTIPTCSSKNWDSISQALYKADFHGSILKVIRSKCSSYVGKEGICILDTRNTFKLLTKQNIVTTIPKKQSVFEMYVNNLKITIFGKQLCVRPAERSTKKVKCQQLPDL